jgi:hypothetical protein
VRRSLSPSAEIQADIDRLLGKGMVDDPQKMLGGLARLGARLIIQRAVLASRLSRTNRQVRGCGAPGSDNIIWR